MIWDNKGKALYADLIEALEERGTPRTKNTIIALCSRLVDKKFLKTDKMGRRDEHTSVVSEAEYQAVQTQDFLEKIYKDDAKGLVAALLQKDLLSRKEYEGLKHYWERSGGSK